MDRCFAYMRQDYCNNVLNSLRNLESFSFNSFRDPAQRVKPGLWYKIKLTLNIRQNSF